MNKINTFTEEGMIYFNATNLSEFRELIEVAQKQAQQLNDTVVRLSNFKIKFKFTQEE